MSSPVPSAVMWALTKKNHAFKVRFNFNDWSSHPNAMTGFHNATSTASVMGLSASKATTGKARATFNLVTSKKQRKSSGKKATQRCVAHNSMPMRRGVKRVARVISNQSGFSKNTTRIALRRLQRIHNALRSNMPKVAAAKSE